MKNLKFLLALISLVGVTAYAGFQGINGSTNLGVFNKIKCSTGLTCTKSADSFSIVSSPSISGSPLSVTGASSTAGLFDLKANANASNGDDWELSSTTSQGGLKFLNNTSGSLVQKMLLDTSGNLTVAGTTTSTGALTASSTFTSTGALTASSTVGITGALTVSGGIASSAATKTIFSGWVPTVVTQATSATPGTTTVYMTQLWVPHNETITGIAVLNAATCGTSKWIVALFDSTGAPVANSALAGTLCSGPSAYQKIAFTGTYAAKGPKTYWIGLYADNATDRYYAIPVMGQAVGLAGSVGTQVFGTVASVTLPTTFTADVAPVGYVY